MPSSSTGTGTTSAPPAPSAARTSDEPGSSTATRSPGFSSTAPASRAAAWDPETMRICSAVQRSARAARRWSAIAARSGATPAGSP